MINVSYTHEFKRNLRHLIKKYPHIKQDIDPVIKTLQTGEILGDQIQLPSSRLVGLFFILRTHFFNLLFSVLGLFFRYSIKAWLNSMVFIKSSCFSLTE